MVPGVQKENPKRPKPRGCSTWCVRLAEPLKMVSFPLGLPLKTTKTIQKRRAKTPPVGQASTPATDGGQQPRDFSSRCVMCPLLWHPPILSLPSNMVVLSLVWSPFLEEIPVGGPLIGEQSVIWIGGLEITAMTYPKLSTQATDRG